MILPKDINGPTFSSGDLVVFQFDGADLSIRIPSVPYNENSINRVNSRRDFRRIDHDGWMHFGPSGQCVTDLVCQSWCYEHEINHDDLANMFFDVSVLKLGDESVKNGVGLDFEKFKLYFMNEVYDEHSDVRADSRLYWPTKENNFFFERVEKPYFDGFKLKIEIVEGSLYPSCCAIFSLGLKYVLRINLSLTSIHYSDRKNPFSEEFLQAFKDDLFSDFIENMHIQYSEDVVKLFDCNGD